MKKFILCLILCFVCSPCFGVVDFNGDADYINLGNLSSIMTSVGDNISLSFWFKIDHSNNASIFGAYENTKISIFVKLNEAPDGTDNQQGRIRSYFSTDGGSNTIQAGVNYDTGITDGEAHHLYILCVPDDNGVSIFVDGIKQTVTYITTGLGGGESWTTPATAYYLGGAYITSGVSDPMDGQIYDFSIWTGTNGDTDDIESNILYSSRVKRIPLQVQSAKLQTYMPLDQGEDGSLLNTTANFYQDISGNGNHGTGVDADGDSLNVGESVLTYP